MQNQRINIYTFPHKGLRNGLSQLLVKMGNANHNDEFDIQDLKSQSLELIHLLQLHQESEHNHVMLPLSQRVPDAVIDCHKEHQSLHTTLLTIEQKLRVLSSNDSAYALSALYSELAIFFAHYLLHMHHEETTINEAIWAHFTDEEILGWQDRIMSSLNISDQMLWFKYIIPALDPMERQILMGGIKANAPADVFEQISDAFSEYC